MQATSSNTRLTHLTKTCSIIQTGLKLPWGTLRDLNGQATTLIQACTTGILRVQVRLRLQWSLPFSDHPL